MRGWYSRGYLPHCDEPDKVQFITYRLHDSLPRSVLEAYDEALRRRRCFQIRPPQALSVQFEATWRQGGSLDSSIRSATIGSAGGPPAG